MTSPLNRLALTLVGGLAFASIAGGAESYGVFKSSDLGRTWSRSDAGLPLDSRVNAFGTSGQALFAGTDSGIFVSRDEARSWQPVNVKAMSSRRILCFADFGTKVFAGIDGAGIWMSINEGNTWVRCDTFPSKKVRSLIAHNEEVFAGTDAEGVFASSDGGETWRSLSREFPDHAQVFALAIAKDTLFAGLYSKGLYAWTERQQRWEKTGHVSPLVLTAIDGTLIAGHNPGGLYWSSDMGVSWSKGISAMPDDPGELASEAPVWELASNEEVVVTGASDGIYYSADRGRSWTRSRTGLPNKTPGISFLTSQSYILAGTPLVRIEGEHDAADQPPAR